jgi:hypothetical protein
MVPVKGGRWRFRWLAGKGQVAHSEKAVSRWHLPTQSKIAASSYNAPEPTQATPILSGLAAQNIRRL